MLTSEALNYATIKAIASGDPLVLEKANIEKQIRELQLQQRAFMRSQLEIEHTIKRHQWGRENWPQLIDRLQADLRILDDGESMIEGKPITTHSKAIEAISKVALSRLGTIGIFRGLALSINRKSSGNGSPWLTLMGAAKMDLNVKNLPHVKQVYRQRIADLERQLHEAQSSHDDTLNQSKDSFQRHEELKSLQSRLEEVEEILKCNNDDVAAEEFEIEARSEDENQWIPTTGHKEAYTGTDPEIIEAIRSIQEKPEWFWQLLDHPNLAGESVMKQKVPVKPIPSFVYVPISETVSQGCLFGDIPELITTQKKKRQR